MTMPMNCWKKVDDGKGFTISIKMKHQAGLTYATATLNKTLLHQLNNNFAGWTSMDMFIDIKRNRMAFRPILEVDKHAALGKHFSVTHACREIGWVNSKLRLKVKYDPDNTLFIIEVP